MSYEPFPTIVASNFPFLKRTAHEIILKNFPKSREKPLPSGFFPNDKGFFQLAVFSSSASDFSSHLSWLALTLFRFFCVSVLIQPAVRMPQMRLPSVLHNLRSVCRLRSLRPSSASWSAVSRILFLFPEPPYW